MSCHGERGRNGCARPPLRLSGGTKVSILPPLEVHYRHYPHKITGAPLPQTGDETASKFDHQPPVAQLARRPFPRSAQASVQFSPQLEGAIQRASERYSMPQSTLRAFAATESGGNSRARTGSYYGVYQLSHSEFRR